MERLLHPVCKNKNKTPSHPQSSLRIVGQKTGVGSLSLLQGIFPTHGLNPSVPHCRWILKQLSHQGSPRILEWGAYPFSRGSSLPRNRIGDFCLAGGFFSNWAVREAQEHREIITKETDFCFLSTDVLNDIAKCMSSTWKITQIFSNFIFSVLDSRICLLQNTSKA